MRHHLLNVDVTSSLPFSKQLFFSFLFLEVIFINIFLIITVTFTWLVQNVFMFTVHLLLNLHSWFSCTYFSLCLRLCFLFLRWSSNLRVLLSVLLLRVIFFLFVTSLAHFFFFFIRLTSKILSKVYAVFFRKACWSNIS